MQTSSVLPELWRPQKTTKGLRRSCGETLWTRCWTLPSSQCIPLKILNKKYWNTDFQYKSHDWSSNANTFPNSIWLGILNTILGCFEHNKILFEKSSFLKQNLPKMGWNCPLGNKKFGICLHNVFQIFCGPNRPPSDPKWG